MIVIGIDAHKRSHTAVAVDGATGQALGEQTVPADDDGHRKLLRFAQRFGEQEQREWAIEDCRHVSRRLESALLRAGERVLRVPPKLMAGARKAARTFGKERRHRRARRRAGGVARTRSSGRQAGRGGARDRAAARSPRQPGR